MLNSPVMKKTLHLFLIFPLFCLCVLPAHAAKPSYFTMEETRSDNLSAFPKWTGMRERFTGQEKLPIENCGTIDFHPCSIKEWDSMIASAQSKPLDEQIKMVNTWANTHPYIIDQLNWGMEDFWETPHEFISVSGDCEDYAIVKYYSLRALGVSDDSMRIIIVQDLNLGGIIHAILGVYDSRDRLVILDNQIKQVMPALKIYHYRPIYSLNSGHWWAYYTK